MSFLISYMRLIYIIIQRISIYIECKYKLNPIAAVSIRNSIYWRLDEYPSKGNGVEGQNRFSRIRPTHLNIPYAPPFSQPSIDSTFTIDITAPSRICCIQSPFCANKKTPPEVNKDECLYRFCLFSWKIQSNLHL